MKILHAPLMNAGQPPVLAAALRRLGHDARTLSYRPNPFVYPADRELDISFNDVEATFRVLVEVIEEGFDVFHFHTCSLMRTGPNLLPIGWDLPLLRALGKTIVFQFRGSDVRLPSVAKATNPDSYFTFTNEQVDEASLREHMIAVSAYADHVIVADPELRLHVPWADIVPRAIRTADYDATGCVRQKRPLVVHAPSKRGKKGTSFVLDAVRKLERDGVDFEFQLIEGVSHRECVDRVKGADIVLDQFHVGWHGVLAIEAMVMGKTVLTYVLPEIAPADMDEWAINTSIRDLAIKLRAAIEDHPHRCRLAEGARRHCERVHEADKVAEQLVALYEQPASKRRPAAPGQWPVSPSRSWVGASRHELAAARASLQRNELLLAQALARLSSRGSIERVLKHTDELAERQMGFGNRLRRLIRRLLGGKI